MYISIDLDVLDPAFAPGVSHHEPGGMSVRDVIDVIQGIAGPVVGADVVELNPLRDINDMTAMVAAKLVKELAGKILLLYLGTVYLIPTVINDCPLIAAIK
jgi:arginase family enzyme